MEPPSFAGLAPDTLIHQRYLVVRTIGRGGMGAVYQALDQRLGHSVALKQMTVSGPGVAAAFEREARLLANLRHPALPRVSDFFSDPLGQFLVMEFIPGSDLGALLAEHGQPFGVEELLRWADQILAVLEYLHGQQPPIIHRDIKPQNLKRTPSGEIVLLDFGLAKSFNAAHAGTTGSLFGYTPNYAPLEQVQGSGTGPASDLYSLAATLYHLLAGAPPPDVLRRLGIKASGEPDPLRPLDELNRLVPAAVNDWLTYGLQLEPNRRPASATAMRTALRQLQRSGPLAVERVEQIQPTLPMQTPLSKPVQTSVSTPAQVLAPTVARPSDTPVAGRRRRDPLLLVSAGLLILVLMLGALLAVQLGRAQQGEQLDEAYAQTVIALAAAEATLGAAPAEVSTPVPSVAPTTSSSDEVAQLAPSPQVLPSPEVVTAQAPPTPAASFGPSGPQRPRAVSASQEAPPGVDASGNQTSFAAANVIDGKSDTAWRVPGNGVGQFLQLELHGPVRVSEIQLIPGYAKVDPVDGTDRFAQNRQIRRARLEFSDGSSVEARFEPVPALQSVRLDSSVLTTFVRVVVLETSEPAANGGRDFTPISEIVVVGEPQLQ